VGSWPEGIFTSRWMEKNRAESAQQNFQKSLHSLYYYTVVFCICEPTPRATIWQIWRAIEIVEVAAEYELSKPWDTAWKNHNPIAIGRIFFRLRGGSETGRFGACIPRVP